MGELADAVLLNHPTLTKMIDRMVSDALVYRVQDPDDRRKVLMFSSDRGKILCKRLNSLAMKPGGAYRRELRRQAHQRTQAVAREPDRQFELIDELKPAGLSRHTKKRKGSGENRSPF